MVDEIQDETNKEMDIFLADTVQRGVKIQSTICERIGIETTNEIVSFSYTFWFEFVKHLMEDVMNVNEGFAMEEEAKNTDGTKVID